MRTKDTRQNSDAAKIVERFEWMLSGVRSVRKNPDALLDRPTSTLARLRKQMEGAFEARLKKVGKERFEREVLGVGLPRKMMQEGFARAADHHEKERRKLCEMEGGTQLLALTCPSGTGA